MDARERANATGEYLFLNHSGQIAHRLILVDESNNDLGRWSMPSLVDHIEHVIRSTERDAFQQAIKLAESMPESSGYDIARHLREFLK